jgi:TPR repeat protein
MEVKPHLAAAFGKVDDPLAAFLQGQFLDWGTEERFSCDKRSADGGCSWGLFAYAKYYETGRFTERNAALYETMLIQAAQQQNPRACNVLGNSCFFQAVSAAKKGNY